MEMRIQSDHVSHILDERDEIVNQILCKRDLAGLHNEHHPIWVEEGVNVLQLVQDLVAQRDMCANYKLDISLFYLGPKIQPPKTN